MEIRQLDQSYQGMPIHFVVKTDGYFHADIKQTNDQFGVIFHYTPFSEQKIYHFDDVLMSEWLDEPIVYGAFEQNEFVGFVELNKAT